MSTRAGKKDVLVAKLSAAYEDADATTIGAALATLREAAGLKPVDIPRTRVKKLREGQLVDASIAVKGALEDWESGQPGIVIVRYLFALARMNPLARHALMVAIDGGEVRLPDPHVARLTSAMKDLVHHPQWPTIAILIEGLLRLLTTQQGEERPPPHRGEEDATPSSGPPERSRLVAGGPPDGRSGRQ